MHLPEPPPARAPRDPGDIEEHRLFTPRRVALLALALALLLVLALWEAPHRALVGLFGRAAGVMDAHPVAGATLFVGLSALSAMLAFVSSAVLVPAAVVVWGKSLTLVLLWTGWLLGGASAYVVARFLGRPLVRSLGSAAALRKYERKVSQHSPFLVVLLLQLALPSELPGYILGLARYPVHVYLLALGLAELPFALGTVYLGEGLLQRQVPLILGLLVAGLALGLLAFRALQRRLGDQPGPSAPGAGR